MANLHIKFRRPLQPAILVFVLALACHAVARENPYDALGKTLAPFVNLFAASSKTPNAAMTVELVVEQAAKLPAGAAGEKIVIALQSPDKLFLQATVLGESVAICRNGQEIWAHPGAKIESLIHWQRLPKADPDFKLTPFQLPLPEKQLLFLPALFQVRDAGNEPVDGEACRVLEVALMPELAHSLKLENWTARLWVRAGYRPVQIELSRKESRAVIAVEKLEYSPALPPETWQPPAGQAPEVLRLTPPQFKQLLDAVMEHLTIVKQPK